jgi:hypothetical protein
MKLGTVVFFVVHGGVGTCFLWMQELHGRVSVVFLLVRGRVETVLRGQVRDARFVGGVHLIVGRFTIGRDWVFHYQSFLGE